MRKLGQCFLILMFLWGVRARAQTSTANLTASDSGACTTANACLVSVLNTNQASTVVQLTGTFSATLQFEGTAGGAAPFTWVAVNAVPVGGTTAVTSATTTGAWRIAVAGLAQVRVRCSAFVSGTVAVVITSSQGSSANNTSSSGGAVSSVFTRTGAVTATSGDYTCALVTNCPTTGTVGSGAAPIMGFYLGSNCPVADTSQCYYSPANTQQAVDCSWSSGGTTVTCASSHFTAADIGKRVFGYTSCNAFTVSLASNSASGALTTSAQLTISAQTGTGLTFTGGTAANTVSGNTHCLVWGNTDDSGAALMDTAAQAATFCPKMHFAAANYMFTDPHFYTQPTACANLGTVNGGALGNIFYAAGYELEGRGAGTTNVYVTPGFPENSTCNHGLASDACWVQTLEGRWSNFTITGGMNATANGLSATRLIELQGPGSLDNFVCTNWGGAGGGTLVGLYVNAWEQLYQVNNSGCGGTGLNISTDSPYGTSSTGFKVRIENSAVNALVVNAGSGGQPWNFTCYSCGFDSSQWTVASNGVIQNQGGILNLYQSQVYASQGGSNDFGYYSSTSGSTLYAHDTIIAANGTGNRGIVCMALCTNTLQNTTLSTTGCCAYYDGGLTTPILNDEGGNSIVSPAVTGIVHGSSSITGTVLATGNVAISTCGSSTAGTFSGYSQKGQFTVTFAGTPGTACTATVTFPNAFWQTPICTWNDVGGTNAVATSVVNGAVSATSTAVTISGVTFTNGNTEILQYNCSNP